MKERVYRICITCQNYKPYRCTVDGHHIGYLDCQEPTKCKAYRLHENYKRSGKWYDSRPEKEVKRDGVD